MNIFDTKLSRVPVPTLRSNNVDITNLKLITVIFRSVRSGKKNKMIKNLLIQTPDIQYDTLFDNIVSELYSMGYLEKITDVDVVYNNFEPSYGQHSVLSAPVYSGKFSSDDKNPRDIIMNKIMIYRMHKKIPALIEKFDNHQGYLTMLALYIRYAGNIALSYGKYIDNPNFNGFVNDDDTIYVKRKDFNNFLSFMLNRKMVMKDWVPPFLKYHWRCVVETHKFGDSTKMFKVNKELPDILLDTVFPGPWKLESRDPVFIQNNRSYIEYLEREIRIFMNKPDFEKRNCNFCWIKEL